MWKQEQCLDPDPSQVAGAGPMCMAMPPEHSNIGILAQAVTQLEAHPFPYRITRPVREQYRFLGPELPESYHPILADVAFGGEAAAAPSGDGLQHQAQPDGDACCPTAGWTGAKNSEDQFIKYMLSCPQTTAMPSSGRVRSGRSSRNPLA